MFRFELPDAFTGALEPNNLLAGATRMFEGQIIGPTSLAIHKDFIYAGTAGGAVWRGNLRTGNATRIAKINNDLCERKPWDSSLCGRPLGVRVDASGVLYFVDAYLGLHSVTFDAEDRVQLTPLLSLETVGGRYMGHLVIDEGAGSAGPGSHMIYITVASSKRDVTQWTAMVIEPDTTGFVVQYDTASGQWAIIWDKLWYPTSIELTDDRSAILVAEFSSRKVLKYYIRGRCGALCFFFNFLLFVFCFFLRHVRRISSFFVVSKFFLSFASLIISVLASDFSSTTKRVT